MAESSVAEQIESDRHGFGFHQAEFGEQHVDVLRIICDRLTEDGPGIEIDRTGPVNVFGGIDTDVKFHEFLPEMATCRQPSHAVLAFTTMLLRA